MTDDYSTETMIAVRGFTKRYGGFTAVDGITFAVARGEMFGLLGPNGAGKTTTLECLEGIRTPDSGTLRVAGIDAVHDRRRLRTVIGVQLQASGMPESITPDEAMKIFCAYHHASPRYDLLERLGLGQKRRTQFHELSTGQQRRLALALAVAHGPRVLFLDEPTAGLDVQTRAELHEMIRELKAAGTTVILATHDMAEAEALADRVAILLNGCIVAVDTPIALTAAGAGLTKISVHTAAGSLLTGSAAIPDVAQRATKDDYAIFYSRNIGRTVSALIEAVNAGGDTLIDLRVERPSLEDRFLELTGNKRGLG